MTFASKLNNNLVVIHAISNSTKIEGKIYPLVKLRYCYANFGLCGVSIRTKKAVLQFHGGFWKQQTGIII